MHNFSSSRHLVPGKYQQYSILFKRHKQLMAVHLTSELDAELHRVEEQMYLIEQYALDRYGLDLQ